MFSLKRRPKFSQKIWGLISLVFLCCLISGLGVIFSGINNANAAITKYINYQAKLMDNQGNVVQDNDYDMRFRIYTNLSDCNADNEVSDIWTETRTGVNQVTVTNGLFSIELGDVTAFSDSAFSEYNGTDYFLGVKIGTDSQMSPCKRIAGAMFAFNTDYLDGLDTSNAGGTEAFVPVTDSTGNLTLTGTPSGSTVADGSVYVNPASASADDVIFGVAVNGTSKLRIDNEGDVFAETFNAGSTLIMSDSFIRDTNGDLVFQADNDTTNYLTLSSDATDLTIATTDAADLYLAAAGDQLIVQNAADAVTGFQVLDADGGTPVLNVDTTNERVGVGTAAPSAHVHIVEDTGTEFARMIFEHTAASGANASALFDLKSNAGDAMLRFFGYSGGGNYIQSANYANTGNSLLKITGYNGNQGSTLAVKMASSYFTGNVLVGDTSVNSDYTLDVQILSGDTRAINVFSDQNSSYGIYSSTDATSSSVSILGLANHETSFAGYFLNASGTGLYSSSGGSSHSAIQGVSSGATAKGVYGVATDTAGANYGVYGGTSSTAGYGVFGLAANATGTTYGVYGQTTSSSGYPGYFYGGLGVYSQFGFLATTTTYKTAGISAVGGLYIRPDGETDDFIYFDSNATADTATMMWDGVLTYTNNPGIRVNASSGLMEYRDNDESDWTSLDSLSGGSSFWTTDVVDDSIYPATITDNVGIGTNTPDDNYSLDIALLGTNTGGINVTANTANARGVYASTTSATGYGIYAVNDFSGTYNFDDKGVIYATSTETRGYNKQVTIFSEANAVSGTSVSDLVVAVYGKSNAGSGNFFQFGVFGESSSNSPGVYGTSSGSLGYGVYGDSFYGVYGFSDDSSGKAVMGYNDTTSGLAYGVYGKVDSGSGGSGVYGINTATTGSYFGVAGHSNSTTGYGVFGNAPSSSGNNAGVYGRTYSTTGRGVYGYAANSSGVSYGVYGSSTSVDGIGVYGYTNEIGTGTSYAGYFMADGGLIGTNYGVYGRADGSTGRGIFGYADHSSGANYGIYGQTASGTNGWAGYFMGGQGVYSANGFVTGSTLTITDDYITDSDSRINFQPNNDTDYYVYFGTSSSNPALGWEMNGAHTLDPGIRVDNSTGNVQYRDAESDWTDISSCSGGLLWSLDAGENSIYTTDVTDNVGIGTVTPTDTYTLHIEDRSSDTVGAYINMSETGAYAMKAISPHFGLHASTTAAASGASISIAVSGLASGGGSDWDYGGYFAGSASNGYGVYSYSPNVGGYFWGTDSDSYGVYGTSADIGMYGISTSAGVTSYGVYGVASQNITGTNYGGYFTSAGTTSAGSYSEGVYIGTKGNANGSTGTTYGGYFDADATLGVGVYGNANNYGGFFQADGALGKGLYATGNYYGLSGVSTRASGTMYGVYGHAESGTNADLTYGGYFDSDSLTGAGVYGQGGYYGGYFQADTVNAKGVYAHVTATSSGSNIAYAVYGIADGGGDNKSYGGYFQGSALDGVGVLGVGGDTGVEGFATTYGGKFQGIDGTLSYGVYSSADTYGVYALATDASAGYGVYAESAQYGVYALSTVGGFGVYAETADGTGVYGYDTSSTGIKYGGRFYSDSTSGIGVFGKSASKGGFFWGDGASGIGVYGEGGLYGGLMSADAAGSYGLLSTGKTYGVYAEGTDTGGSSTGVYGLGVSTGVYGLGVSTGGDFGATGATSVGVFAYGSAYGGQFTTVNSDATAVHGYTTGSSAIGVHGEVTGSSAIAIFGESTGAQGKAIVASTTSTSGVSYGVYSTASGGASATNYAGWFETDAQTGVAIYGKTTNSNGTTYGVVGIADGEFSGTNYGGFFRSDADSGIAVYGYSQGDTSTGLYGETNSTTGITYAVRGNAAGAFDGEGYGGYFTTAATEGVGVYALATGDTTDKVTYGVRALTTNTNAVSYAVYGSATGSYSSTNYGGYFTASGTTGIGVFASAVSATGYSGYFTGGKGMYVADNAGFGVDPTGASIVNVATSTSGDRGVNISHTGTSGYGIYSEVDKDSSVAGYFLNSATTVGSDRRAIYASATGTFSASGIDQFTIESHAFASGSLSIAAAVYGKSNNTDSNFAQFGIYGETVGDSPGVYGLHNDATGIGFGVYGTTNSELGYGVYGAHTHATGNGFGVYGITASATGNGVYGAGSGASSKGVRGHATGTSGIGVQGQATNSSGVGVYGYANNNIGVYGVSAGTSGYGVRGLANGASAYSGYFTGGLGTYVTDLVVAASGVAVVDTTGSLVLDGSDGRNTSLQHVSASNYISVTVDTVESLRIADTYVQPLLDLDMGSTADIILNTGRAVYLDDNDGDSTNSYLSHVNGNDSIAVTVEGTTFAYFMNQPVNNDRLTLTSADLTLDEGYYIKLDQDGSADSGIWYNSGSGSIEFDVNGTTIMKIADNTHIYGNGSFYGNSFDYAEFFPTNDLSIKAGEIVSIDKTNDIQIERTTRPNDVNVLGIISTNPGFATGVNFDDMTKNGVPVALSGRVPTFVSTENGPISRGDFLTSSSTPGVAMKATEPGMVVGVAMEDYNTPDDVGSIIVFVNLQWYGGNIAKDGGVGVAGDAQVFNQGIIVKADSQMAGLKLTGNLDLNNNYIVNVNKIVAIDNKWSIDENGVFVVNIDTTSGDKQMYSMHSAEVEFTMTGSSQLHSGEAHIPFKDSFEQVISQYTPYKVILTPNGDTNGLYVDAKHADGFVVKELNNGTSEVSFDWLVIGVRKGYEKSCGDGKDNDNDGFVDYPDDINCESYSDDTEIELEQSEQPIDQQEIEQILTDPVPTDPIDTEPTDPAPTDPVDTEPTDPAPADPVDTEPIDPAPADPVDTEPTDPAPTDPIDTEPTDPAPTDPIDTEPTDPVPADPVDPEPIDPVPADPVDPEPIDPAPADPVDPEPIAPAPIETPVLEE